MAKTARRLKSLKAKRLPKSLKIKTRRRAYKSMKVLGSGKVKVSKCNRNHFTGWRSASRQNGLSKGSIVHPSKMRLVYRMLPNSF